MTKVLVFDNYDSFTYNLVHLLEKILHTKVDVRKNDRISLSDINKYDKILLSPGPGVPREAGLLQELIKEFAPRKSILGVCLGHQGIGQAFGAELVNLENVFHGVSTEITILDTTCRLFSGLERKIVVGRYHSWVLSDSNFPDELEITAVDDQGLIMGIQHRVYDVQGVQFHPESVLTPEGERLIRNWIII